MAKLGLTLVSLLCRCCHVESFVHHPWSRYRRENRRQPVPRRWMNQLRHHNQPTTDSVDLWTNKPKTAITSAVLKIGYDGARFSGWSAANQDNGAPINNVKKDAPRSSKRRRKHKIRVVERVGGKPRSVEGVLRWNLAKVFGNVDPDRIVVEACSRTDKGVHAHGMVALVYCLKEEKENVGLESAASANSNMLISGKRLPHPRNSTDESFFRPLRMNVQRLGFTLNRMFPPDIRIAQAAEMPHQHNLTPFHPSLCCTAKTYQYHLSFGSRPNLVTRRCTWHVAEGDTMDLGAMQRAAQCLTGRHDFEAFRGAPRGASDKAKFERQTTQCNVMEIEIVAQETQRLPSDVDFATHVTLKLRADRFLYKMARFLVGAVVAVGSGTLKVEDLQQMLETGQRNVQFECAPPHGLFLENVEFDDNVWGIEWNTVGS